MTHLDENGALCGNQPALAKPLTSRELDVVAMPARRLSVHEISDALNLAERSVRAHVQMIVEKLGVSDAVQAVAVAVRDGFISSPGRVS